LDGLSQRHSIVKDRRGLLRVCVNLTRNPAKWRYLSKAYRLHPRMTVLGMAG